MEEHLYSMLSSALSFPIAWGTLGEGTSTPRAVMTRVSGIRSVHLQGKGLMESRVQVDCYGASYSEAITASRAVREELELYKGGPIQGAFLDSTRDMRSDDAGLLYRVSLTFLVKYQD